MGKIFLVLILSLIRIISYSQNDRSTSAYLNQETPNDIPVIFAPDLISKMGVFEYPCSFSADMKEMYFGVNMFNEKKKEKYILQVKRQNDGTWSNPQKLSFTDFSEMEPILSADNSKLFFSVLSNSKKYKPHDIWYVNRENDGWGKPVKLNEDINTKKYEYYASMTLDGKMYFTREGKGIFSAELTDNEFTNVQLLEPSINNLNFCTHPFVSPDETYLIFDSRERGGFGKADLYISFRENNHWGNPINLGEKINTSAIDFMPIVSPDGEYLFFCRKENNERDIYWVKFDVEKYRN